MKYFLTICTLVLLSFSALAQDGGMRIYAGATSMANQDDAINPSGFAHSGYHLGVDARLFSGGMSFLVGGRYTLLSKSALENFRISSHDSSLTLMSGRVGLDFNIISVSNLFRLRSKALASFDVIMAQTGPPTTTGFKLNDGWLGIVTGIGADIGFAIVDIEYEIGVVNGYNKMKESTFNTLTLSVGFFF